MEIIILLVVGLLIGLWALGWALRLVGALIGAVALCCRSEPKQEPQGYTLAEILADKPQQGYTINLN